MNGRFFSLVTLFIFGAGISLAADFTGKDLAGLCNGTPEQQKRCLMTLKDAIAAQPNQEHYCLPTEFDLNQVRLAYISWANEGADELNSTQRMAIQAALIDQFPCEE